MATSVPCSPPRAEAPGRPRWDTRSRRTSASRGTPLSEADFPGAGIELKVVPMRRTGRGLGIKERTVISMIDYDALVLQTWDTAKVRSKLHILFVFFEHLDGRPKAEFPIRRVLMWKPDERTDAFLRADWERVNAKVRHGLAHQLVGVGRSDHGAMHQREWMRVTSGANRSQPRRHGRGRSRSSLRSPCSSIGMRSDARRHRSLRSSRCRSRRRSRNNSEPGSSATSGGPLGRRRRARRAAERRQQELRGTGCPPCLRCHELQDTDP